MKRFVLVYICFTLLFWVEKVYPQVQYSSYEGTHFFVGFMQNEIVIDPRYGGLHLKLFIFPSSTTNVTLIFPNDSVVTFTNVNTSKNLEIDVPTNFENFESEVVRKKAIEIISTNPIIVYAFSTQYLTSEAYSAIPVEKWGKEYVVISYPNDQYSLPIDTPIDPSDSTYRLTPRQSEFLLLAAYDSTQITFYPRSITEKGAQVNNPKTVILNKGQTYLVKSFPFVRNYGDLSGTFIRGDKPFGVLSGHVRTAIPQNLVPKWDSKNHLVEMLMPANSWGREFITVPFGISPYGDLIKITSYFPNTTITAIWEGGSQTYVLNQNFDVLEIPFVNEPRKWISDKPVQMAQFIMHSGLDWDSPNFDPAMTLIPPLEQFVNYVTFQTPGNSSWNPGQFLAHFVNIVGTIDALDETYLNSVRIVDIPNDITLFNIFNNTYFWANIKIRDGIYNLQAKKGKIAGVVYGVGLADAYALVLGSSLVNPYIGDSTSPELTYEENCGNLNGYFYETNLQSNTGIVYAYVISDSTFNYLYSFSNIVDTTNYVYFSAKPTDPYQKGKVVLEVRDRNGNSRKLSYEYNPPLLQLPSSLEFNNIKPFDSLIKSIKIKNLGNSIQILRISLKRKDDRFRWYVDRRIPINLSWNDTVSIFITCSPNGVLIDLYDTLIIEVDCNLTFRIPINTSVLEAKLEVFGYDFGSVYIGDTAIGRVGIANFGEIPIRFDSIFINSLPNVFLKIDNPTNFILQSGDTTYFSIKFAPNNRQEFNSQVVFYDELKLNLKADIRGVGIAPLISSIVVDFGRVRIGKTKDTVVYLINKGNTPAKISFIDYINFDSSFYLSNFDIKTTFSDSLPVFISFTPQKLGNLFTIAEYSIDWELHPKVKIEVRGEGILPQLETYNYYFDTVFVDEDTFALVPIVRSIGTEDLLIYEIRPFQGDLSSFEIDFNSLKSISLPIDSILKIPVKFHPSFVGNHQITLEVISNAVPGDSLAVNHLVIYGVARSRDTLLAEIEIESEQEYLLCNNVELLVKIINKGNVPFVIKKVDFLTENFEVTGFDSSIVGTEINPTEVLDFNIIGFGKSEGSASIEIIINYGQNTDSLLVGKSEFRFQELIQNVFVESDENPVKVGGNYNLNVSGEFVNPSELPFEFVLNVKAVHKDKVSFNRTNFVFNLKNFDNEWQINPEVEFTDSEIKFILPQLNLRGKNAEWSISIPFSVYLTNKLFSQFEVSVEENICFKFSSNSTLVQIEPFCAYPLRDIEIVDFPILVDYYPNPITNFLTLEFESKKKDFVILEIFDKLGSPIGEKMKIEIDIGKSQKNVDFYFVENGIYFVKLNFNNLTKYIKVLKLN